MVCVTITKHCALVHPIHAFKQAYVSCPLGEATAEAHRPVLSPVKQEERGSSAIGTNVGGIGIWMSFG